jgi:hypothetical protein
MIDGSGGTGRGHWLGTWTHPHKRSAGNRFNDRIFVVLRFVFNFGNLSAVHFGVMDVLFVHRFFVVGDALGGTAVSLEQRIANDSQQRERDFDDRAAHGLLLLERLVRLEAQHQVDRDDDEHRPFVEVGRNVRLQLRETVPAAWAGPRRSRLRHR